MERRGARSEVGWRLQQEATERLTLAAELGRIQRERESLERTILDLSGDVTSARRDRDAGMTPNPDLETQRREGREAWLAWRATPGGQTEEREVEQAEPPKLIRPDDDFAL